MRIVAIIILVFGVALAGGAVFFASEKYAEIEAALLRQAQEATPQSAEPAIKTVQVVVANKAMRYGAVLDPKNVSLVEFPEASAPPNSFNSMEDLFGDNTPDERRIVLRAIDPNEPILKSKVTGFGERATISAQLAPGMRAFTLPINQVSGVAGFLLPKDRVDIFLTRSGQDGLTSNVIMQNVKVIAVDQFSDQDSNRARVARTVTMEVTPEQAQKLALAQQLGRISLSLRQIDEVDTQAEVPSVNIDDVIVKEEEEVVEQAPVKRLCVRKGTELVCNN